MRILTALLFPIVVVALANPVLAALPSPTIPDGLGVNIHFTDPRPGEMKMLAAGGFTWIRMDFAWAGTEREKGKYDFTAYERLLAALDEYKIRAVFILDYGNELYDKESPHTDEARTAMAKWAVAAVKHFKGRGVIWEMWNEPNIDIFWKPKPSAEEYAKLALAVGKAIHDAAPDEIHVGPATSLIDMKFLETCFKAGCLEHWSAVSVHPYRQEPPETAAAEFLKLRALIDQYAPKGKNLPILSGEWGYSSGWNKYDPDRQGKYLPLQWLTNISSGVPLSIWYDWHDDGPDPKEGEHHFGTVTLKYFEGRDPVYDPKPAYVAAKTLTTQLREYRFGKRIESANAEDFVLMFEKAHGGTASDRAFAVWTTAKEPRGISVEAKGSFLVTDHLGISKSVKSDGLLKVMATDGPQYVTRVK